MIRTESSGGWQNRDCGIALPYVCKKKPNATTDPFLTGELGLSNPRVWVREGSQLWSQLWQLMEVIRVSRVGIDLENCKAAPPQCSVHSQVGHQDKWEIPVAFPDLRTLLLH